MAVLLWETQPLGLQTRAAFLTPHAGAEQRGRPRRIQCEMRHLLLKGAGKEQEAALAMTLRKTGRLENATTIEITPSAISNYNLFKTKIFS